MPIPPRPAFAIKGEIADLAAAGFVFARHKTMYGGKNITVGDCVFLFARQSGRGLFARGIVRAAEPVARIAGVARQTPRVSVSVARTGVATQSLGRAGLASFTNWTDGQPQTELNFKLYRQATDKIVGLTPVAAAFLDALF